jgi:hypothetical protein
MNCIEQAMKIYEICVPKAKAGETVNYREVLDYLGYKPRVRGHAIRYGLELTWIACADSNLPKLTSIVVNKATGQPTEGGFPLATWKEDTQRVFSHQEWLPIDDIDWDYVWENRIKLSNTHATSGFWTRKRQ